MLYFDDIKQQKNKTMKTITGTYNKTTTLIETEVSVINGVITEGASTVKTYRTKKSFFDYIEGQDACKIKVTSNLKGFVKKMEYLGFECDVDSSYGFESESQVFCCK
jgi:hypothetical protein